MRSLDIAGTGMQAQQTNVEVISNNIANMTTTGFKRRRAEFQDLIYQNLRRVGSNSSDTGTHRAVRRAGRARRARPLRSIGSASRATCSRRPTRSTWRSRATAISRSRCRRATPPTHATARSAWRPTARSSPPTAMWCSPEYSEVDPVSWTPDRLRSRSPRWPRQDCPMHLSSAAKW